MRLLDYLFKTKLVAWRCESLMISIALYRYRFFSGVLQQSRGYFIHIFKVMRTADKIATECSATLNSFCIWRVPGQPFRLGRRIFRSSSVDSLYGRRQRRHMGVLNWLLLIQRAHINIPLEPLSKLWPGNNHSSCRLCPCFPKIVMFGSSYAGANITIHSPLFSLN